MRTEIKKSLAALQPLFEGELRASIKSCITNSKPYGYALMIGEDLELASPIAITNSEAALAKIEEKEFINDMRYIPDEWEDWHNEHFPKFRSSYDALYSKFADSHTVTNEDCYYTDDALEFMDALYEFYLNSMKSVTKEFDSIWYWIIWISDSDRKVINESFFSLNSGRAVEEGKKYFQ